MRQKLRKSTGHKFQFENLSAPQLFYFMRLYKKCISAERFGRIERDYPKEILG